MNRSSLRSLPERLEPVRLLKESKRGSVSVVCCPETGQQYVLRRYRGDGTAYRAMMSLSSPFLPAVHSVTEADGETVVVEELVEGTSLARLLERRTLSLREARRMAVQLCSALSLLHRQGIVHRDVKPDNVILRESGAVLVDFDAARLFEPGSSADTQVLGTVGFAAPEQFGISQSDTRADIYAMGVMLNIMLTGSHPSMGQQAPGFMGKIVRRCTMANPGDRYQTVEQLRRALRAQPGRPWLAVPAAAAAAAVLAFAAIRLSMPAEEPPSVPPASAVSPAVTASAAPAPAEATPRPLLIPLAVRCTTVSHQFSDETVRAEFTRMEVQPTVEELVRVTVGLSVDRPFTLNVWTASGSWTLSPLSLEKGEHSVVLHVPEDILTDSEQLLFSLTAADSPEENRLVVRLSGEDVRARLQLSPAPTPTPSPANDQITFTDPARTVLYTNRSLTFETFLPMGIQPYGVKLIHAQAQPLEGDMARITVFFSVERDMDLQIRTGSGSWSLPSVTVTPGVKQVAFDIPRSALESDPMLQITLCSPLDPLGPPADGTDALRAECQMRITTASVIDLLTIPDHDAPKPTPTPGYTVPTAPTGHPGYDPALAPAGPAVKLNPTVEYGAHGYEAYGMEIYGVDAQLMEGDTVRFTLHLLAEMDFHFVANLSLPSGNVWSSGAAYGYQALTVRAGSSQFFIDIPLKELSGRTTLWMELSNRVPSLDGTNPSIENRARIFLGVETVLNELAAVSPDLPDWVLSPRRAVTSVLSVPFVTNYTGSDGLPSSGFTFYDLTVQVFSDDTATFLLTFRSEGVFNVSFFEPPSGTGFGMNTFGPGESGWSMSVPLSLLSFEHGITYKFYQQNSHSNCGYLHVAGSVLRSVLTQ